MAKNLQTVLNSVVNDLLQESSEDGLAGGDAARLLRSGHAGVSYGKEASDQMMQYNDLRSKGLSHQQAIGAMGGLSSEAEHGLAYSGAFGQAAQREAQAKEQIDAINAQNDVPFSDQAYSTYLDAKNQVGNFVNDHPYATAGIGAGLGAALAAGAGALYLRKKQREANRAAGR